MNRKRLYVILGLLTVAGVAGGLVWWTRRTAARDQNGLRSAMVEQGTMLVTVSGSGSIRPVQRVDLAFEISGQVAEVAVDVGDQVQSGQLLIGLDRERLRLQLAQAEANLASATAQVAKLEAGPRSGEVDVSEANLRAAQAQADATAAERDQVAQGARQGDIAAAEAELASALTQQKKAQDWHDATLECFTITKSAGDVIDIGDGQVITLTEDFKETICPLLGVPEEQARYRLEAADEALEAAQAHLEQIMAGADQYSLRAVQSNLEAAIAQRDGSQAQLDLLLAGPTREQLATAKAGVDQARSSVRQAELALAQTHLAAPFDGIVAALNATVGEQATAGLPIVTLLDPSRYCVTIAVDELEVSQLAVGQKADLAFDALPNTAVSGTVKHIGEAATVDSGVITYDVRIDLPPTEAPIRADMTTSAAVIVEEISDALKIPTWALQVDRTTRQYYVQRRTSDGTERVNVRLGARQEGVAQVLEGLSAGDEIVRSTEPSQFDIGAILPE